MRLDVATIVDIFRAGMKHDLPNAQRIKRNGEWVTYSSKETYRRVVNLARAMQSWGIKRGERVAILSENRPEWAIVDFACAVTGIIDVPLYPTLTAEQAQFILKDSNCRVVFASTIEQCRKVNSIRAQTQLERVILMDDCSEIGCDDLKRILESAPYAPAPEIEALADQIKPDDLATIIYTSGTTGTPKGVMLTHGNIASNILGSTTAFDWSHGEGYLSFLPLSHITARHVDYCIWGQGIDISYCPHFEDLPALMREVAPHNFVSVPRVYEKVRQEAERKAGQGLKKKIFRWALGVGKKHREEILAGKRPASFQWNLAKKLVFSKIHAAMGGRMEACISGGAPLGVETAQWFADIGIRIFEGYGLTETSPVIGINTKDHYRLGSIGRPLPNVQVKLAPDGELLVKGPSVTKGYWNLPEETANAFEDGWFKTGDIASIDADGFISITDRKKDLIKTSGGKFIAPAPIENQLKANVLVAQAVVIGDRRRFPSVLIQPHFPLLEDWAHANDVKFSSRNDLINATKVRALYEGIVADVNSKLAQFERMKQVLLVPDEFSIATGEITASMKLKRRVVESKYAELIDHMYSTAHVPEAEAIKH